MRATCMVSGCKLWIFADADHAGEYDNRSTTSGCFLVLVGPNIYYPLTAFSKKQRSVSVSSTESEVVSANVSLRAVGFAFFRSMMRLQNAGGIQSIQSDARRKNSKPEGLPRQLPMTKITTSPNQHGEHWEYDPSRRCLSYINPNPRSHLFVPSVDKDCFIPPERLARTTIMSRKGKPLDLVQDNWRSRESILLTNHGPEGQCSESTVRMMLIIRLRDRKCEKT